MTLHRFVVNLRAETITHDFVQWLRPPGWLAAPDSTTARTRTFAADAARRGRQLVADNGNYTRIGELVTVHAAAAAVMRSRVTAIEAVLDRTARRADLPLELRQAYDDLAEAVAIEADRGALPPGELLRAQQALGANRVIGVEDITAATLLALDGEPHLLSWSRTRWRQRNARVAASAAGLLNDRPDLRAAYHPVASALDWNTAHDAGRVFARAGLARVAMGFGAYLADDHHTDFVVSRGRTVRLPARYPQRYVRAAAVADGFFEGYRQEAGRHPEAFHFLGLGAPMMMAVVSVAADGTDLVSFDATSPIRDAVEGTLYVARPALLKVRARKVACRMAFRHGSWACPCGFCRSFAADHPWDLAAARAWGAEQAVPRVDGDDLGPRGGLFAALPLLSEPAGGALRALVTGTRMGHNHWVLQSLCRRLDRAPDVAVDVGRLVEQYAAATASPVAGDAVRVAYELVADGRTTS